MRWVTLHRPDGEEIRIAINQIVYISKPVENADSRAKSELRLTGIRLYIRESPSEIAELISEI